VDGQGFVATVDIRLADGSRQRWRIRDDSFIEQVK
jgi:hypothetical protein